MYDHATRPWHPRPNESYTAPPGPTLARWKVHRARRIHRSETYGDLARHPWRGLWQVTRDKNLYAQRAAATDLEMRLESYGSRLREPRAGTFPLVRGLELGTGAGPWWGSADEAPVRARAERDARERDERVAPPAPAAGNPAQRTDGPGHGGDGIRGRIHDATEREMRAWLNRTHQ
jgi:hypothetical protein